MRFSFERDKMEIEKKRGEKREREKTRKVGRNRIRDMWVDKDAALLKHVHQRKTQNVQDTPIHPRIEYTGSTRN